MIVRGRENKAGDPGLVSRTPNDPGGPSYGLYQFNTNDKVVQSFLEESGFEPYFRNLPVNSPAFDHRFAELARSDPAFVEAQHEFARRHYYEAPAARLAREGVDLRGRGRGVQEIIFTTMVRHGPSGGRSLIRRALAGRDLSRLSEEQIVDLIQDEKQRRLEREPRNYRRGIQNRINAERTEAQTIVHEEEFIRQITGQ